MPDKTALQQLKDWYNEYRDEYKANPTYFEVFLKIEKLLPVERDAIVEAHKAGDPFNNIHDAEQYYETRYGSLK